MVKHNIRVGRSYLPVRGKIRKVAVGGYSLLLGIKKIQVICFKAAYRLKKKSVM